MSAERRGALGVANSRVVSRPGGGVWRRDCGSGFVWMGVHGVRIRGRQLTSGELRCPSGEGGRSICPHFREAGPIVGKGYWAGRAVPVTC